MHPNHIHYVSPSNIAAERRALEENVENGRTNGSQSKERKDRLESSILEYRGSTTVLVISIIEYLTCQ